MTEDLVALPTLPELQHYVRTTLCSRDRLDPARAQLRQANVVRRGKPCGLFFQLIGAKNLRAYAVWAADEGRLLFYDHHGTRYLTCQLAESPTLSAQLRRAA